MAGGERCDDCPDMAWLDIFCLAWHGGRSSKGAGDEVNTVACLVNRRFAVLCAINDDFCGMVTKPALIAWYDRPVCFDDLVGNSIWGMTMCILFRPQWRSSG